MKSLKQKRKDTCLIILATVFGSAVTAAAPKASLDITKQVFLTVADVAMCMMIWNIYFGEKLFQKRIISIFFDLFCVIILSSITAYISSRGITALGGQLVPWLGEIAWWIIGAIAALATSLLGGAWTFYCDDLLRSGRKQ